MRTAAAGYREGLCTFNNFVFLLPCYTIEDLSLDRGATRPKRCWLGLDGVVSPRCWWPGPRRSRNWPRPRARPKNRPARLIVVPPCCERQLPGDWVDGRRRPGPGAPRPPPPRGHGGSGTEGRRGRRRRARRRTWSPTSWPWARPSSVEMLTRQLRYMSNLDEVSFRSATVAAAKAAVAGDQATARERPAAGLRRCCTNAREYFYPVESHLLDLTLVARDDHGRGRCATLAGDRADEPAARRQGARGDGRARAGDARGAQGAARSAARSDWSAASSTNCALPLMPIEAIGAQFSGAWRRMRRHLGRGRRCSGGGASD